MTRAAQDEVDRALLRAYELRRAHPLARFEGWPVEDRHEVEGLLPQLTEAGYVVLSDEPPPWRITRKGSERYLVLVAHKPQVLDSVVRIWGTTDPELIGPAIAKLGDEGRVILDIDPPFPAEIFTAAAVALDSRPEITLLVDGRVWDQPGLSLEWLERFPHVRHLRVEVYDALDLSPIRHLQKLRKLHVGETKRRMLSLAFLRETPLIEELSIDGTGGRDFDAIAGLDRLRLFTLRAPRTKTLDALRDHPTLEGVTVTLGGIRDLTPLATIPNLRALDLWGIRLLDTDDFAAIGDCASLGGLSLGALPHVRDLSALTRGPAETLRFLMLDRMRGLETLRHLADCKRLEEVFWAEFRPPDEDRELLATLQPTQRHVHWRMRPEEYLDLLEAEPLA